MRSAAIEVDIVLLDVEMPGTSGLEALPDIIKRGKRRARADRLVDGRGRRRSDASRRSRWAPPTRLPKPGTGNFAGRFAEVLADRLRRIGRAEREAPAIGAPVPPMPPAPIRLRAMPDQPLGCLALGASTGGLHALIEFLRALPRQDRRADPGHPASAGRLHALFARQLETASGRARRVAEDGHRLKPDEHPCRAGRRPSRRRAARRRCLGPARPQTPRQLGLPAVGRSDAVPRSPTPTAKSGVGVMLQRHGPRRPGRQRAAGRARRRDAGPGPSRPRRSGACRARSPRRGSPRRCCSPADLARRIVAEREEAVMEVSDVLQPHPRRACSKRGPASS